MTKTFEMTKEYIKIYQVNKATFFDLFSLISLSVFEIDLKINVHESLDAAFWLSLSPTHY